MEIEKREDVELIVRTFYSKVRQHPLLAPIFEGVIKSEEAWEEHFVKLTDFWETNLFVKNSYKGNPLAAHIEVDRQMNNTIAQEHFGHWLNMWIETVDSLFTGELAFRAKQNARNMAGFLFLKLYEARHIASS